MWLLLQSHETGNSWRMRIVEMKQLGQCLSLRWLSATCSYQSIIIHTQCYATSQECGYTTHCMFQPLFREFMCTLPLSHLNGFNYQFHSLTKLVDPCNATPVEIWSVDNHASLKYKCTLLRK